jgi:hypothetical protein
MTTCLGVVQVLWDPHTDLGGSFSVFGQPGRVDLPQVGMSGMWLWQGSDGHLQLLLLSV